MSDKAGFARDDVLQQQFQQHDLPPAYAPPPAVTVVRVNENRSQYYKIRLAIAIIFAIIFGIKLVALIMFLIIWYN